MNPESIYFDYSDRPSEKQYVRTFLGFFVLFGMVFSFVFRLAATLTYGHHDDYHFWQPDGGEYFLSQLFSIGRPLAYYVGMAMSALTKNISGLTLLRQLGIAGLSLSAALYSLWLYSLNVRKSSAFLISAGIFTLPGFAVFVSYVTGVIMETSVILALLAGLSVGLADVQCFRDLFKPQKTFLLLLGLAFLFSSLMINQPSAMFFLVVSASLILFGKLEDWRRTRAKIAAHLILLGVAMSGYFISIKIYLHRINAQRDDAYAVKVSMDIPGKIKFFFLQASPQAFSLWIKDGSLSIFVALFILAGIVAGLIHILQRKREAGRRQILGFYIQSVLTILLILPLSFAPNLAAQGSFAFFRHTLVYSSIVFLWVSWALGEIAHFLPNRSSESFLNFGLLALGLAGFFSAQEASSQIALSNWLERNFVAVAISDHSKKANGISGIHLYVPERKPGHSDVLGKPVYNDEINSTAKFSQDLPWLIASILQERGEYFVNGMQPLPSITFSDPSHREPVYTPKTPLIIDLSQILPDGHTSSAPTNSYLVQFGSSHPSSNVISAFDGSVIPSSFWEASPFPVWLQLEYPKNTAIANYTFASGETGGRMPKAWRLQGSTDSIVWSDVDVRTNQTAWPDNQTRSFVVAGAPAFYKFYRFLFTEGNDPILRIYEIKLTTQTEEALPGAMFRVNVGPEAQAALVTASSPATTPPVSKVFDGSLLSDSFWEIAGFPQWVQIEFKNKFELTGYSLGAGEYAVRMPKDWILQGSADGKQWKNLDARQNQIKWTPNSKRWFKLQNRADYKLYRLLLIGGNDPIIRLYELEMTTKVSPDMEPPSGPADSLLAPSQENFKSANSSVIFGDSLPILVKQDYKGYNIVRYKGLFYGVSRAEGEIDIREIEAKARFPWVSNKSIEVTEAEIDNFPQPPKKTFMQRVWGRLKRFFD